MVNRFDIAESALERRQANRGSPIRHWRLLARAGATLARARLSLVSKNFDQAIRFGSVPLGKSLRCEGADDIVWAIEAVARRVPFRAYCIEQGLAAQRLLRRSGIDAVLHYGARHDDGELKAHVWVTVDGVAAIGGEQAPRFREVASYP